MRAVVPELFQSPADREPQFLGSCPGQSLRLVEAPLSFPLGTEGDPGHQIQRGGAVVPDTLGNEQAVGPGIAWGPGEFIAVDGVGHPAPVGQGRQAA